MGKINYKKLCGIFFVASPSRALKNACVGGCLLGYRGIKRMCENCKEYNTRNYIEEGIKALTKANERGVIKK